MKERVLQQIPIPEDERQDIKALASGRGMKIYELTDEILQWYFARHSEQALPVLASPRAPQGNKYWSLWLLDKHMVQVENLSLQERCSGNRIIYSAFKHWLEDQRT